MTEKNPEIKIADLNDYIKEPGPITGRGTCGWCNHKASLVSVSPVFKTSKNKHVRTFKCSACDSLLLVICDTSRSEYGTIYPSKRLKPNSNHFKNPVKQYYEEGVECMNIDAYNGALSCFRKAIESTGKLFMKDDFDRNTSAWNVIESAVEQNILPSNLKEAMRDIKNLGNNGVHVNDKDPGHEDAIKTKTTLELMYQMMDLSENHNISSEEKRKN